ncbi:MAG: Regulatory protein RecX [Frankiales bacterium]|nr:Regulatory protein RecX [Frankiales bacterium]
MREASRPSSRGTGGRGRWGRGAEPPQDGPAEPLADPESVARQICLQQLEFAPRTRAELAAVLARKGVSEEAAETVLSRFAEVGLIDDALFAQMWVASRHNGRGLAGRALSQELRRKGVEDEVAAAAVGTLDPEQERATARALVDRKLRTTRGLPVDARVRRLAGLLARKGYSAGLAFAVVREALAAEGEDERLLEQLADLDGPLG